VKFNHDAFLSKYTSTMANISGSRFDLIGTASLTGNAAFNRALSKHRADSIAAELRAYGATEDAIRNDVGLGSVDLGGNGIAEDFHDRGVLMDFSCPASAKDALASFQTAWNSDPLKLQAALPD
jgi:hypothetical protein